MRTPEEHTRFRVQRLIRMGEWLERNEALLVALYDAVDDAHTEALEAELDDTLILEHLLHKQMAPLRGLGTVVADLRMSNSWGVKAGEDVTLHHPRACAKHQYEVVIPATKPSNDQPNNEETK